MAYFILHKALSGVNRHIGLFLQAVIRRYRPAL